MKTFSSGDGASIRWSPWREAESLDDAVRGARKELHKPLVFQGSPGEWTAYADIGSTGAVAKIRDFGPGRHPRCRYRVRVQV